MTVSPTYKESAGVAFSVSRHTLFITLLLARRFRHDQNNDSELIRWLLLVGSCQGFLLQRAYIQCVLVHALEMPSRTLPHPRVYSERNFIMGKAKGPLELTTHRSLEICNSSLCTCTCTFVLLLAFTFEHCFPSESDFTGLQSSNPCFGGTGLWWAQNPY